MRSANGGLSPPQHSVLVAVKRHGEVTADQLASDLGISPSAVRQHLSSLRSAGLVVTRQERGQLGRPADRYQATAESEPYLSSTGRELSVELLGHIEAEEPGLVGRAFERRRIQMVNDARQRLAGKPLADQVSTLTSLLEEQGYLADYERLDSGQFHINLRSCAMWAVANRFGQACAAELDFVRDLIPGASVERLTHKTDGAHTCTYRLTI